MVVTVPRTLLALMAVATVVRGEVLDGLCLLAVLAVWIAWQPDPYAED